MADRTTDHAAVSARAARRRARRERALRLASVAVSGVMLALIVSTVLVITGVVEVPGTGSTVRASRVRAAPTSTTQPPARAKHRALTIDAPLRLWIAGDSLAGSIGPSLGQLTAATGVVAPQYDSRVSSGLLTPGFFDWPQHAQQQLQQLDPEAVVFVIGTNDANVWSPGTAADYRLRTMAMMRELVGRSHRPVYWVGPPVARDPHLEKGVQAVAQIAREVAAEVAGVTYVDAHALFADAQGEYQQSFADEFGQRHVMRAGDGVHFSVDGADYVSRAIFKVIDRDWRVTAQADPTHPQPVKETRGSTQVPGTHRSISPSGSSGGSATTTTTGIPASTSTTTAASTTTTTSTPGTTSTSTTSTTGATPPRS
jgi:hypothetical protein